jgi:hypothetical protein
MAIIPNFPENLTDMHHNWHTRPDEMLPHPGAGPRRSIPQGAPGSGLEFLTFHRNFVAQFHAWYDSLPFGSSPYNNAPFASNADAESVVSGWTAIPNVLEVPGTFWNSNLANQETRIQTNSPAFSSADDLGIFIENGIHNWIHGATATVFGEPVVGSLHSPQSTFFYKIHGLVDYWWSHWFRISKPLLAEITRPTTKIKIEGKELFAEIQKRFVPEFFDPVKAAGFENPLTFDPRNQPDPAVFERMIDRLTAIETQLSLGQAFIQSQERPNVGETVANPGKKDKSHR